MVSTSIYDPRPRTRTYTRNFPRNKKQKQKSSRAKAKYKNYKLPIRGKKVYSRDKQNKGQSTKSNNRKNAPKPTRPVKNERKEKSGRSFEATVPGFDEVDKNSATMLAKMARKKNISLCGISPDQQLKLAAVRYRTNGNDFWPGPLSNDGTARWPTTEPPMRAGRANPRAIPFKMRLSTLWPR